MSKAAGKPASHLKTHLEVIAGSRGVDHSYIHFVILFGALLNLFHLMVDLSGISSDL